MGSLRRSARHRRRQFRLSLPHPHPDCQTRLVGRQGRYLPHGYAGRGPSRRLYRRQTQRFYWQEENYRDMPGRGRRPFRGEPGGRIRAHTALPDRRRLGSPGDDLANIGSPGRRSRPAGNAQIRLCAAVLGKQHRLFLRPPRCRLSLSTGRPASCSSATPAPSASPSSS